MILFKMDNDKRRQVNTAMDGISPQVIENNSEVFINLSPGIILNIIPLMVGSKNEKINSYPNNATMKNSKEKITTWMRSGLFFCIRIGSIIKRAGQPSILLSII